MHLELPTRLISSRAYPDTTNPSNETSQTMSSKTMNSQASHSTSTSTNQRGSKVPSQPPGVNQPSVERGQTTQRQQPQQPPNTISEKWATSEGKKYLEKELKDASSHFHNMSIKDIHESNDCFRKFPLKNFKTNYTNLKQKIEATAARVEFDNKAVQEHKKKYP